MTLEEWAIYSLILIRSGLGGVCLASCPDIIDWIGGRRAFRKVINSADPQDAQGAAEGRKMLWLPHVDGDVADEGALIYRPAKPDPSEG